MRGVNIYSRRGVNIGICNRLFVRPLREEGINIVIKTAQKAIAFCSC